MSVIFLTLAAGSILYVVIQLLGVAHKNGRKELLYWGVLPGWRRGSSPTWWSPLAARENRGQATVDLLI